MKFFEKLFTNKAGDKEEMIEKDEEEMIGKDLIKDGDKTEEDVQSIDEIYSLVSSSGDKYDFKYYQEKFGLETWELEKLMKASSNYLKKGEKSNDLAGKSEEEIRDLAIFYPEYLASLNDYSLPFSEEDIKLLDEAQKSRYLELSNQLLKLDQDITRDPKEGEKIPNYISDRMAKEYMRILKDIYSLELRLEAEIGKIQEREKNPSFKDIKRPEYSEFDIQIQDLCYGKVLGKNNAPLEIKGKQLNDAEVAELALEAIERKAKQGEIFVGDFIPGEKTNQLIMKDRIAYKRDMLYIANNVGLQKPGKYVYTIDLNKMRVLKLKEGEKIDPKKYYMAIAEVSLPISLDRLKDLAAQRRNKVEEKAVA